MRHSYTPTPTAARTRSRPSFSGTILRAPVAEPTASHTVKWNVVPLPISLSTQIFPPIIVTIVLFVGLFLTTSGLDRIANPRLRGAA